MLVILVGILGTIVGFYFATQGDQQEPELVLALSSTELTGNEGTEVTLAALATNGEPPYEYSFALDPTDIISGIPERQSNSGWLVESITLPEVEREIQVTVAISVTDAAENETQETASITITDAPSQP